MSQQQNISQQPQNSFTSQQPYSQPYSNHDQRQLQYQQQLQLQRLAEQRAIVDPRMVSGFLFILLL